MKDAIRESVEWAAFIFVAALIVLILSIDGWR